MSAVTGTGYTIERIFAQELHFQGIPVVETLPQAADIQLQWDWQVQDEYTFLVIVSGKCDPSQARPEKISARIVGQFRRIGSPSTPDITIFTKLNAVTTLMPFVREAISSLSMRGTYGPMQLDPVNVVELAKGWRFEESTGADTLRSDPAFAVAYGVTEAVLGRVSTP